MLRLLPALILFSAACYSPVEYDVVDQSRVVKLRVSDNTILGTISDVSDGRSLCSIGNNEFLVASGNGTLYRFDSPAMELDTSFVIGFGSGSGYGSMITPKSGSMYVIGTAGKIIVFRRIRLLTNLRQVQCPMHYVPHPPVRNFMCQTVATGRSERLIR